MHLRAIILACATLTIATAAFGTSFVVPTDAELVAKSSAIVIGTVEGSFVQENDGTIETTYEIRAERSLKSAVPRGELIRVVSPGGVIGDRGLWVPGSAHFRQGERVLIFLTREAGVWRTTDMTLGKFRFAQSTAGERLLVRDMEDVVGWDHAGQEHRERVRREPGFLRFIGERVSGRPSVESQDYQVQSSAVTLQPSTQSFTPATNATFPPATYTDHVADTPIRWPNMAAGVTFWKRSDQNITGASDGGVSAIQNGLAAWTNDCGSNINLVYGGQRQTASANHDGINMVEYNDPQGRISNSWTGSGTIGITFLSFAGEHTFSGQTWLNITDADVVFQNGYPATHAAFGAAMTHELGHGIGWRHSNQNHLTGGACNSAVEECSTAAIMNSSVNASHGYTLQPWDVNAARSVYPGGTCGPVCSAPVITQQPGSDTITYGTSRTLTVGATGTGPLTYQWFVGESGDTSRPISGATSNSVTVSPTSTTAYWVRVSNGCGTANSSTATIVVIPPSAAGTHIRTDFDGDGRADVFWRNSSTGENSIWFMNGTAVRLSAVVGPVSTEFVPAAFGDFNGDGRSDVYWRSTVTQQAFMWFMNGTGINAVAAPTMPLVYTLGTSGDFDGDGRFDFFWRNQSSGENIIWYMNGASIVNRIIVGPVSSDWTIGASGDFDANGRFDIFWRSNSFLNMVWLTTMTGGQSAYSVVAKEPSYRVIGSGDFNNDGRWDIFWRDPATGADSVFLMNGASASNVILPTVHTSYEVGVIGDFDADGDEDVIWRNSNGGNVIWPMSGGNVAGQVSAPGFVGAAWKMYGLK